jgi:hypothetical protein
VASTYAEVSSSLTVDLRVGAMVAEYCSVSLVLAVGPKSASPSRAGPPTEAFRSEAAPTDRARATGPAQHQQ